MARKIEKSLYRITLEGGYGRKVFVEAEGFDDINDYVTDLIAEGNVVSCVNLIKEDGSSPKVAILSSKEFKQLLKKKLSMNTMKN